MIYVHKNKLQYSLCNKTLENDKQNLAKKVLNIVLTNDFFDFFKELTA